MGAHVGVAQLVQREVRDQRGPQPGADQGEHGGELQAHVGDVGAPPADQPVQRRPGRAARPARRPTGPASTSAVVRAGHDTGTTTRYGSRSSGRTTTPGVLPPGGVAVALEDGHVEAAGGQVVGGGGVARLDDAGTDGRVGGLQAGDRGGDEPADRGGEGADDDRARPRRRAGSDTVCSAAASAAARSSACALTASPDRGEGEAATAAEP